MARVLHRAAAVKEVFHPAVGAACLAACMLALTGPALAAQEEDPVDAAPEVAEPEAEPAPPSDDSVREDVDAAREADPGWLERLSALPVHGYLSTWYRGRWTSDDSDNDLRASLYVDVGDPEEDEFTGHLSTILYWDLDGRGGETGQSTFFEITDTYDSRVDGRLYEAYVDAHHVDGLSTLRVGRQQIYRTPELAWFDGVHVETEETTERDLSAGAYAGVPVHVFESSPSGDALFGLYAAGRPWNGGRLRLDWMRFQDENLFGQSDTDLYVLGWWQRLGRGLSLEGDYGRIDESSRDVRVRASYFHEPSDLTLQASYYELLDTQKNLALDIDPFFGALLDLFPYYQTRFLASKSLTDWIFLETGFDVRRVKDETDVGQFNRDFERYYAVSTFQDVVRDGLDVGLTGEVWSSDDTDLETWGADLTQEIDERWEASLGTYYSLYKYDYFLGDERDYVRTYYLKVGYDRTENLSFDLGYEFEDDDFDDYQTLRLGMSWRF